MNRTANKTEAHYIFTNQAGETVATDKTGQRSGIAAYARMMERVAQ